MTPNQCKCSMSISVLGDGCRYCQPQEYIDRLIEQMQDDAAEAKSAPAEPVSREAVAWQAGFSGEPQRWDSWMTCTKEHHDLVKRCPSEWPGYEVRELFTAPPSPDAELVELVRSKFPRIDPCQPVPLDEKAYCCEYSIYAERERLHRLIDAKLASLTP